MGRASDCTIPIRDRFLSRRHAEISFIDGAWILTDCGSANGTFLNGSRVDRPLMLRPGDRISLGDSHVLFEEGSAASSGDRIALNDAISSATISIPVQEIVKLDSQPTAHNQRLQILNRLALELIEDRPLSELFDFIIDRVMDLLKPSRAALALLTPDRASFDTLKVRRRDSSDSGDLTISRTLLNEVVLEKKVLSFYDVSADEHLAQAKSIVGQNIRSVLCAPLLVNDTVLGVLYADYILTQQSVSEDDVRLAAQIARFAAIKLETTRLREQALAKEKMEEELRTAYAIQKRILPKENPDVEGWEFAGVNRPLRTVSGDYFDYVPRPDGRIYFTIADVSGKGVTAALLTVAVATGFNIFAKKDLSPAEILREINENLSPKTSPTKFVTMVVGLVDPQSGRIEFSNAGHTPPLVVRRDTVEELKTTDMVVGLFPTATYRNQEITLGAGDALVLFTDGITEAENEAEEEFGSLAARECVNTLHGKGAAAIIECVEQATLAHAGSTPMGDDVTLLAISRK